MIIEFSVENFGSIRDKQILSFEATNDKRLENQYLLEDTGDLRLLKIGFIYGANASGKTTILKGLHFLRRLALEPTEKKSDPLKFEPFLFDAHSANASSKISLEFLQKGTRYIYNVEFNRQAIVNEQLDYYKPTLRNVFKRTTDIENQFTSIKIGGKIHRDKTFEKVLTANTLWNNTVLGGFLKTNVISDELKDVQEWFEDYLRPMIQPGTELDDYVSKKINNGEISKKDVIKIVKRADFQISDIFIKEEEAELPEFILEIIKESNGNENIDALQSKIKRIELEFEHTVDGIKYPLPFKLESQGTKRYYGFAGILALMIKESKAFPIDELESSLHPDLYIHFILSFLFNVKHSQLICTTHNREILDNRDIFRDDVIWFADKTEHSATELYSLADFDSSVIRNTSNVYNAYKIGKLGGVPQLGDYLLNLDDEEN